MAKIRCSKSNGKKTKEKKINSIVGENYLNDFESRKQEKRKMAIEENATLIKAEEIVLLQKAEQSDNP